MDGKSLNLTQELLEQLQAIIPQAFSEGKLDTTALKTLLGEEVFVQGERYGLSWAGKSDAYKVLQQQTTTTLIPELEQSVDWDNAQHVFIEGENLEVLKLLQKSYFGQVKMIYIDPPYNTGSDSFIYPDKFSETKEEYLQRIGDKNDEGYMLREGAFRPNRKESGQYHSNWLNMMLPRLYLARNLLRDDGVIFVSINDHEMHDLVLLLNDIFGEENKIATLVWDKNHSAQAGVFKVYHEYVLVYAKNISEIDVPNAVDNGAFEAGAMKKVSSRHPLCEFTFPKGVRFEAKDGEEFTGKWGGAETVEIVSGRLRANNKKTMDEVTLKAGFTQRNQMQAFFYGDRESLVDSRGQKILEFYFSSTGKIKVVKQRGVSTPATTLSYGTQSTTSNELTDLLGAAGLFDNPKPPKMLKDFVQWFTEPDDSIIDFFAGSGTTAQAVMELNEEDGGNRRYICVQLPEKTEENSEAAKTGYATIADITSARIKKVIAKIEAERAAKTDLLGDSKPLPNLGFRKFTLAPSNFKLWRGDVIETEEDLLRQMRLFATPQRANVTTPDMAWELLLKSGYDLTEPVTVLTSEDGLKVYHTADQRLALVLDGFSPAVQAAVLQLKPKQVILLDSVFAGRENGDSLKTNAQLTFEDQGIAFKTV